MFSNDLVHVYRVLQLIMLPHTEANTLYKLRQHISSVYTDHFYDNVYSWLYKNNLRDYEGRCVIYWD